MTQWYAVNAITRQEERAQVNLDNQGYETWLPVLLSERRHARRVYTVREALFPGYLFIRLDADRDHWAPVNGTGGVRRLLTQQGRPVPVPGEFIGQLQEAMDETGCLQLPERRLTPGQKLRFVQGPYRDCLGTLLRMPARDRVSVLLHIFNRPVPTTVPRTHVVLA